jgi:hypothetical protein
MAIIYSYQENEDLLNSDMLVGTATTLHNGKVRKITKNFTLGQLKTFINTGDLILSNGGTSGPATLIDNILNIPVYQGQITLTTTGSSGAATLIGNTLNIPQYGGTPPTPTLNQVLTAGNTSQIDANVGIIGLYDSFNSNYSYITGDRNRINFYSDPTTRLGYFGNNTIVFDNNAFLISIKGPDTLTANRTIKFPDATGTVALTSDIPVVTTPTLQQVTTAGNTTTDAVTLGTTTIKQSTGTSVAIFKDNTNATVGTVSEFGSLNFIGGSHTFGATGNAELIAGTYRTQNYGDGFKDAGNNVNFVASLNTGSTFGWSSKGTIEYAADYSANFGNRTLVDKAYVLSVIPSLTGYVPTSRTLTINGTAYDLTADRSWSVGTVTAVTATSPITSSGGTAPTISTSMSTNKLIGRSTAGTGVMEEIAVGSGLTLTGAGVLNNTATPSPLGYYGAWQDNFTQTAAVANVGYPLIYRTVDLENQVRVVTNGTNLTRITFDNTGIYNLQFSVQIQNTGNAQHDVTIWIRKNGVDVAGSSGYISVPARKSAGVGNEGHGIYGWNYLLSVVAGEYYEIIWSTSNATDITIQYYTGSNPPPSTASVIATVTQQSGIMAGTGITAINSLTGAAQTLATNGSGTDFNIVSSGTTHTFNLPTASVTNRGALSSTDWTTFNAKQNALLDIASVQDNGIYSTFMNGAISYFLGSIGVATFYNLRIPSSVILSGSSAYFGNNAIQFSTTATAGTLAFQRGTPFYHSGRSLFRFQPNIVSSDARYFVGLSNLYQVTAPTNVEPTTLTQTIGVAKLSTSANLFIIHNDGTGTATSVDLGVNYPATSNLYIYDIKITSSVSAYTGVTVRRTTISTGATISTDYAVTSNFPSGVAQNPALWITNNASAVANSLYYFGAIGYNTTI